MGVSDGFVNDGNAFNGMQQYAPNIPPFSFVSMPDGGVGGYGHYSGTYYTGYSPQGVGFHSPHPVHNQHQLHPAPRYYFPQGAGASPARGWGTITI